MDPRASLDDVEKVKFLTTEVQTLSPATIPTPLSQLPFVLYIDTHTNINDILAT
jgi:hypothetical protein